MGAKHPDCPIGQSVARRSFIVVRALAGFGRQLDSDPLLSIFKSTVANWEVGQPLDVGQPLYWLHFVVFAVLSVHTYSISLNAIVHAI